MNGRQYEAYLNKTLSWKGLVYGITWDDAWARCQSKGEQLAVIKNDYDKQAIFEEINSLPEQWLSFRSWNGLANFMDWRRKR